MRPAKEVYTRLLQYFPPVNFAFAYGSVVFEQLGKNKVRANNSQATATTDLNLLTLPLVLSNTHEKCWANVNGFPVKR